MSAAVKAAVTEVSAVANSDLIRALSLEAELINRLTVSVTELSALVQAARSSETLSRAVPLSNKISNLFFSEVIEFVLATMLAELEFTETPRLDEVVPFELMSVAF